jgi:hypothetical protein
MLRLNAAINSLEAVAVNLQSALTYLDMSLRSANEIDAKDLITRLEAIKAYVQALTPCENPIGLLKELATEYQGSLEDVERQLKATQIVDSLVDLNIADKKAAITSVTAVLLGLDTPATESPLNE